MGSHNCGHSEDASVVCSPGEENRGFEVGVGEAFNYNHSVNNTDASVTQWRIYGGGGGG